MNNNIKHSLTTKITLGFIIVISVIGMFAFSGYYYYINKYAKRVMFNLAGSCAKAASSLLYNAPLDKFLKEGKNNLYYGYFASLAGICHNFNIKYIYVYVPDFKNNKLKMIFDLDGESNHNLKNRDLGAVVAWKFSNIEKNTFYKGVDKNVTETNNQFGHVVTRYVPVYSSKNKPIALVGVDVSVSEINSIIMKNFLKGLLFIITGLVVIYLFLILYIKQVVLKPIALISSKMNNFIKENKPGYEPIKLNSDDELATMADSFNRMVADINSYVQKISDMQMETIFSLAKLTQSRDDSTGKHLERVQQYCYILAEKLSQDSPYSDLIDANFINNLVNASILHDIGKVGVSDLVLLKEGKLTDEEYLKLQLHTVVGYNTLNEVHSKFGNNSFIEMGMIIARYHHERWDGKGYPEKLFGEEIPLAARIMALADVYDALSTKRVYKDAFSKEKCIEIIKSGSGTQFDAVVVDAFLGVADKFYRIRQDYEQDYKNEVLNSSRT